MTRWTGLSYAYAALVAGILGSFLYDIPIQVSDSYGNLVQASRGTLVGLLDAELHQQGYLRPLLWGLIRVVYDASGGAYFAWFRGWHVAQVMALALLFVRLLRPTTATDAAVVPLGLAALVGGHTFAGTVEEAFPINTFMTILLCCFVAAELVLGPPRWWRSVAAVAVFVFAALTVETGLLVAVIVVAGWLTGARGVSKWGVASVVVLTGGYFYLRFIVLGVAAPGLVERSSGFGFSTIDPPELIVRFGTNPWLFYLYNVVTSSLSVFLAEPRAGTWNFVGALLGEGPSVSEVMAVVASTSATLLLGAHVWQRRGRWRREGFDRGDHLIVIFGMVTAANAAMSYAYTKDVIISPAGAFFAIALAVAARQFLVSIQPEWTPYTAGAVAALVLLSATWTMRAYGAHVALHAAGGRVRTEWVYVDQWLGGQRLAALDARAIRLKEELQADAVWRRPPRPLALPASTWFDR